MPEIYTHGHHAAVISSHSRRTAENSAAYLLDRLRPGLDLLDAGCGPGTLTLDLAGRVAPGRVVGIDASADVISQAEEFRRQRGLTNVEFRVGDIYQLDLPDQSVDVVHAHQLLQHLSEPVAALTEMRRVLRPGGCLAVRDSDYGGFVWAPDNPRLDRWMDLYHQVTARNGGQADAGRYLLGWVRTAGFEDAVASSSTWTFADDESRQWWASTWAERVRHTALAEQARSYGLATEHDLADMADGWRDWAAAPDACFIVVHAEVLAHRPPT